MQSLVTGLLGRIPYRLDVLVVAMLVATALDAWTTYVFISQRLGVEMNQTLAPLAEQSLAWIPVYLFTTPLLIPLMCDGVRQSFAVNYLLLGLSLGLNNLGGILQGNYFLVDGIGFPAVKGLCGLAALAVFVHQVGSQQEDRGTTVACGIVWFLLIGLIYKFYYLLAHSV